MEKFFKQNWYWFLLGIVGLILIYVIYKAIKKSGQEPHQKDIDEDIVGSAIPQEDIEILTALAENLKEDIHCWVCTRDEALYEELSVLSDNYLVGVSNIYNELFEKEYNETLYQAMNKEYYALDGFGLRGLVDGILDRFRSAGIS